MKKKLLGLISVVLSLCMLCACNSGLSLNSGSFDVPTFTPAAAPAALFDKEVDLDDVEIRRMGKFILFENESVGNEGGKAYVLYNVETATVVKEWTQPNVSEDPDLTQAGSITIVDSVDLIGDYGWAAGWMVKERIMSWQAGATEAQVEFVAKTTIYDINNVEVASDSNSGTQSGIPSFTNPTQVGKNFIFADALYRCVEDDDDVVIIKDETYGPFSFIPSVIESTEDYLYNSVGDDYIEIYNHDFEKLGCYNIGDFDEIICIAQLENGNLFAQYIIELPFDAEDYDVYDGAKIDVITEVYNVEKDSVEQIDCDYIISVFENPYGKKEAEIIFGNENDILGGAADNIIRAAKIENKRVNTADFKYYTMSNDGKIEDNFPELIPNQEDIRSTPLEDRFIVLDKNGTEYFVTGSGEVLGVLPPAAQISPAGIVLDGKIYDKDLKVVVDYEEEGYDIAGTVFDKFIFEKEYEDADNVMQTAWYVYETDGDVAGWKPLADTKDNQRLYTNNMMLYVIVTTETVEEVEVNKYTIYSIDGTALVSNIELDFNIILYGTSSDVAIIVYTAENVWKINVE